MKKVLFTSLSVILLLMFIGVRLPDIEEYVNCGYVLMTPNLEDVSTILSEQENYCFTIDRENKVIHVTEKTVTGEFLGLVSGICGY